MRTLQDDLITLTGSEPFIPDRGNDEMLTVDVAWELGSIPTLCCITHILKQSD